jgi:queuosine precursor transporter
VNPALDTAPPTVARSLQTYSVLYGGLLVVAGVLGFKLIKLQIPGFEALAVPGGVFGFLLAIVTVNATAELHGRPVAQRMVLHGVRTAAGGHRADAAGAGAAGRRRVGRAGDGRGRCFGSSMRLILAGMVAYGISQSLDVTIFTWMRGQPGGHMLWLRATVAAWSHRRSTR